MLKLKTTNKAIKASGRTIFAVGYCNLDYLLWYKSPFAYTSGINGWSADFYETQEGVIISTGYRSIGVVIPSNILKKYNETAKTIVDGDNSRAVKIQLLDDLLVDFVKYIGKEVIK